jgi:hypothetical protein
MLRTRHAATAIILILLAGCRPPEKPMDEPPYSSEQWVIRTDFSDDAAWSRVRGLIAAPQEDVAVTYRAYVKFISDEANAGKKPHDLIRALPDDYPGFFCFIVDRECLTNPEHPVLVVGFYPSDSKSFDREPRNTPPGDIRTFRALPAQIQAIQNNLDIANMDFEDFGGAADKDGVFRGFK